MERPTVHFLLVYSFDEGRLVRQSEFSGAKEATAAYTEAEQECRNREDFDRFEVVLVGADSIQTVMQTHGHYFKSSDQSLFSDFLAEPASV